MALKTPLIMWNLVKKFSGQYQVPNIFLKITWYEACQKQG